MNGNTIQHLAIPSQVLLNLQLNPPHAFTSHEAHPRSFKELLVGATGISDEPQLCPWTFPHKEDSNPAGRCQGIVEVPNLMQALDQLVVLLLVESELWIPVRNSVFTALINLLLGPKHQLWFLFQVAKVVRRQYIFKPRTVLHTVRDTDKLALVRGKRFLGGPKVVGRAPLEKLSKGFLITWHICAGLLVENQTFQTSQNIFLHAAQRDRRSIFTSRHPVEWINYLIDILCHPLNSTSSFWHCATNPPFCWRTCKLW